MHAVLFEWADLWCSASKQSPHTQGTIVHTFVGRNLSKKAGTQISHHLPALETQVPPFLPAL